MRARLLSLSQILNTRRKSNYVLAEVIDGKLKEVILPDKHFSANFQGELEIWSSWLILKIVKSECGDTMWLLSDCSPIRAEDKSGTIEMAHSKHIDSSWFGYLYPNQTEQHFFYVVSITYM